MTKLELEAIRALPADWVRDGVEIMRIVDSVVASDGVSVPIVYSNGRWETLRDISVRMPLSVGYWDMVPAIMGDKCIGKTHAMKLRQAELAVTEMAGKLDRDFAALPKPPRPWDRRQEPGRSKFF